MINSAILKKIYLNNAKYNVLSESISLDDVERYEPKKELNERIWNNLHLRSKVRMRLLDISDDFYDTLGISDDYRIDTILTGSICNYNWTSSSDIDLHIIIDFSTINSDTELVKSYFDMKKNEWNKSHLNLKIYNFPIEVYVQDINEKHVSHGIYSLERDAWIIRPSYKSLDDTIFDENDILYKSSDLMDIIDDLEKASNLQTDKHKLLLIKKKVFSLYSSLKNKRKKSLNQDGEMGKWNIIWKILRNDGYIEKLIVMKAKLYDKINTID